MIYGMQEKKRYGSLKTTAFIYSTNIDLLDSGQGAGDRTVNKISSHMDPVSWWEEIGMNK